MYITAGDSTSENDSPELPREVSYSTAAQTPIANKTRSGRSVQPLPHLHVMTMIRVLKDSTVL